MEFLGNFRDEWLNQLFVDIFVGLDSVNEDDDVGSLSWKLDAEFLAHIVNFTVGTFGCNQYIMSNSSNYHLIPIT